MAADETFELTIEAMAYGGEGLGRAADGRMIFVAFCLPGERVRVREIEAHKRWGRAELVEILEPSDRRIEARCRHYGICGGCHYQHTDYQQQLIIKRNILVDQLERLGGLQNPPVKPTIPSPEPWNYRNRLRFHVLADGNLGFYRWDGQGLFEVEQCHLPDSALSELWPQLSLEARQGIEQVELRLDSQAAPMIILHGQGAPDLHLDVESSASVIWHNEEGTLVLAGDPHGWMEVKGKPFRLSPGSFFQTNSPLLPNLVDRVLALAAIEPGQVAFDLYAGVGLFSAFMADAGARVVAVEQSSSACADFEINLQAYDDIALYESSVAEALPAIGQQPDVIMLDPPRAGLDRTVVEGLNRLAADRFVYLSCDPATLARDAKGLVAGGYQLQEATPIDLFPQTYHLESVSLWRRSN